MRISAFVLRIIRQILRDKRTLALILFAPLLILTMLWLVFDNSDYKPKVGVVYEQSAQKSDSLSSEFKDFKNQNDADKSLKDGDLDGYLLSGPHPKIVLEGSDPSRNRAVLKEIQDAMPVFQPMSASKLPVEYVYGSKDMGQFDSFGPVLLGFFCFFFVFLISGVSFLRERTSGTLERLLASPIKIWEMVISYVIGFGIFMIIQASLLSLYAIYVLDMMMTGSFFNVLIIILLLSLTALTLGILLSAFARNELQMMQFIPLVIVPQIFFSGLFNLDAISDWLSWIGPITPLYYAAQALKDVMIKGYSFTDILTPVLVLTGFSLVFILLNIFALNKYRKTS
ncbi:ABC transporter permease [Falsibacillus pallidus]|uniref:ABC-2 type transport system permease protein n=1 Tax=Falsibacillus pallidus TaxID=493781 RepID=A0A370GDT6_9BACI|nr:ABC transporter permease [Falsibacillus pallidus]RDI41955.1 ABC-2 type transport system permease protein [Falsibacillus pallidus]